MPTEENKFQGHCHLYRSIWNDKLWIQSKKKSLLEAWLDLILMANGKKCETLPDFLNIVLERGQLITSQEKLSIRWGWSRTKVRRFLMYLKSDRRIDQKAASQFSIITICNYDFYNDSVNTKSTGKVQVTIQAKNTNNNIDTNNLLFPISSNSPELLKPKVNTDEKKNFSLLHEEEFLKFVDWLKKSAPRILEMKETFTIEEFLKLKKFPKKEISEILLSMHNYKPLIQKNINAYLTFLNWHRRQFKSDGGNSTDLSIREQNDKKLLESI